MAKVCCDWNVPLPLPSRTLTLLLLKLATTRSGMPFGVKSAAATANSELPGGEGGLVLEGGRRAFAG